MSEPPLVAIEIASPTQATQDLADKIRQMLAAGVQSAGSCSRRCRRSRSTPTGAAPQAFLEGPLEDSATGIEIDGAEVFASA